MKRIITIGIAISASAGFLAAPTFATTVTNNRGSIIKVSSSCSDLADVASNNRGSIVKIDGGGQCDINEVLKSSSITNNRGSVIHISNVCGDTTDVVTNNRGSVIKIDSNGPCDKSIPTTVVVTPAEDTPAATQETTAKTATPAPANTAPVELPKTGTTSNLLSALAGLSVLTFMAARYIQSKHTVASLLNVK